MKIQLFRKVKEHSPNMGTKTGLFPVDISTHETSAGERTFPKHGDENSAFKFLMKQQILSSERTFPKHGDENYFVGSQQTSMRSVIM